MGGKKKQQLRHSKILICQIILFKTVYTLHVGFFFTFLGTAPGILPQGWSFSPIHSPSYSHPEPFPACSLLWAEQGIDAVDWAWF